MNRNINKLLKEWVDHPYRKPLILKGARQVGKSWAARYLGESFKHFIEINFERDEAAKELFAGSLEAKLLVQKLSLYANKSVVPGKTLIFLDEIQDCEQAIVALRYFKEELPELHIIAAGSLIEFALEKVGMPVGRVQFLHVYPLSFSEFLSVQGRDDLRDYIKQQASDKVIHELILDLLKTYLWLGGMPAVVQAWIDTQDPKLCQELQSDILLTYRQDFAKYAQARQLEHVEKVFASIPQQLGDKFKYVTVDAGIKANDLRAALDLLTKASIANIAYHTSAQGQPLAAGRNEKRFKAFFFDIGLAQRMLGLELRNWLLTPINVKHLGAICEQFVAQEYISYKNPKLPTHLYYWHREAKTSNAEVDFVFIKDEQIIPAEVKNGSVGKLKSLHLFLESHEGSPYGLKVSEEPFSQNEHITTIPLFGLEAWLEAN